MSEPTASASQSSASDSMTAALSSANSGTEAVTTPSVQPATSSDGNPAWGEILSQIPEMLHDKIKPVLSKWDQGVQQRFEKYTPFKEFEDLSPDSLRTGQQLLSLLETDPQRFYEQMGQSYGYAAQGQGNANQQAAPNTADLAEFAEGDLSAHPQFKQMMDQQQQMLQNFQAYQQQQQQAQAQNWLAGRQSEIAASLKQQGLEPDWDYILSKATQYGPQLRDNDKALDKAASDYVTMVNKYRTPVATNGAPPVLAPTGQTPVDKPITPQTMNEQDRRTYLAQLLRAANKE